MNRLQRVRRRRHRRVEISYQSDIRDLQFIRINGTVVGGLVGMTLHFINTVL